MILRYRFRISALVLAVLLGALWLTALAGASVRAKAASSPVPRGFVGMVVDGPLFPDSTDLAHQLDVMVASGVQTIRVEVDWAGTQPYKNWSKVPAGQRSQFTDVGGIPTEFGPMDQLVGLAAQRGLTILPDVLNAPGWDGQRYKISVVDIPRKDGPYANFMKALVNRYGPNGSFWPGQTVKLPIREWQVWNEPNITPFWPPQPFEPRYVGLLRATHAAIKSADPGAKVMLAGMPNFSWQQLTKIYAIRGARNLFDVVAVHPYTKDPQGVITILNKVRAVMNAHGDSRKPIVADEISWPSSLGKTPHTAGFDFATTPQGQASRLAQALPLLARNRARLRLMGFYYYTWVSVPNRQAQAFTYSGLFNYRAGRFIAKPAYSAFRRAALAMEHCREKGATATDCLEPS